MTTLALIIAGFALLSLGIAIGLWLGNAFNSAPVVLGNYEAMQGAEWVDGARKGRL